MEKSNREVLYIDGTNPAPTDKDAIKNNLEGFIYDGVKIVNDIPSPFVIDEEKLKKMNWSCVPPMGSIIGDFYFNQSTQLNGENLNTIIIVKNGDEIVLADFDEHNQPISYEKRFVNVSKKYSDYGFFQAASPRTNKNLHVLQNGIWGIERYVMENNTMQIEGVATVSGASNSIRNSITYQLSHMEKLINNGGSMLLQDRSSAPKPDRYFGNSLLLPNGLIGRVQIVVNKGEIIRFSYDEIFLDRQEYMINDAYKRFYRQSKYWAVDYGEITNDIFKKKIDNLKDTVIKNQKLIPTIYIGNDYYAYKNYLLAIEPLIDKIEKEMAQWKV